MGEGFGSMRWRVEIILQKSELGGRGWKGRIYGVVAKWNSLDGSVPRITRARSPSLFHRRPTRVHRRLLRFVLFKTVATAADEHATRCLILRKGFIPQPLSLPHPLFYLYFSFPSFFLFSFSQSALPFPLCNRFQRIRKILYPDYRGSRNSPSKLQPFLAQTSHYAGEARV